MGSPFGIVISALIAFAVSVIVARRVSSRVKVVDYLNAENLQIWEPNGKCQAWLTGGEGGATLYFFDRDGHSLQAIMRPHMLSFMSSGTRVALKDEGMKCEETNQVERLNLGVEEDGSVILNFFSDIKAGDWPPQRSVAEFKLSREGNQPVELGLPSVRISYKEDGVQVHPGSTRITVFAPDESVAWQWPQPIAGGD